MSAPKLTEDDRSFLWHHFGGCIDGVFRERARFAHQLWQGDYGPLISRGWLELVIRPSEHPLAIRLTDAGRAALRGES